MVFTIQHVLLLKLFMVYNFPSYQSLHDFLFLVEAETYNRFDLGFYDFYRAGQKTCSPTVELIIREMKGQGFIEGKKPAITEDGREVYYALASALEPFQDYVSICLKVGERYTREMERMKLALKHNLLFRRARPGEVIMK